MAQMMSAPHRPRRMPRIGIQVYDGNFAISVDGRLVRDCSDELDAHHWAKHAFEAVSGGARSAQSVADAMERICLRATRFNLHTHHFGPARGALPRRVAPPASV